MNNSWNEMTFSKKQTQHFPNWTPYFISIHSKFTLFSTTMKIRKLDRKIQNSTGRRERERWSREQRPYHPCMSKELLPSQAWIEEGEINTGEGRWLFCLLPWAACWLPDPNFYFPYPYPQLIGSYGKSTSGVETAFYRDSLTVLNLLNMESTNGPLHAGKPSDNRVS